MFSPWVQIKAQKFGIDRITFDGRPLGSKFGYMRYMRKMSGEFRYFVVTIFLYSYTINQKKSVEGQDIFFKDEINDLKEFSNQIFQLSILANAFLGHLLSTVTNTAENSSVNFRRCQIGKLKSRE